MSITQLSKSRSSTITVFYVDDDAADVRFVWYIRIVQFNDNRKSHCVTKARRVLRGKKIAPSRRADAICLQQMEAHSASHDLTIAFFATRTFDDREYRPPRKNRFAGNKSAARRIVHDVLDRPKSALRAHQDGDFSIPQERNRV